MSFLRSAGLLPYARVNDRQANQFASRLRHKLELEDFAASESVLAQASDENRERMIYGVASSENSVPLAAAWVAKHPRSAFANVLLGACLIDTGWQIRGSSYAENVDPSAWGPFLSKLRSAEEPLHRAIRLDDSLAEPYAWLIHAGMGQGAPREELHELYVAATSRVPLHFPTHYKYFMATTEKWGGSHKEMFAFVRERAEAAPQGHALHCLIPSAYNDFALAAASERSLESACKVLRQPNCVKELVAALHAWLPAKPEALSERLLNASGGFSGYGLNHFGVALYLCGARDEAKEVLLALNGEIESTPWAWISRGWMARFFPAFAYDRACRELGVPLPP